MAALSVCTVATRGLAGTDWCCQCEDITCENSFSLSLSPLRISLSVACPSSQTGGGELTAGTALLSLLGYTTLQASEAAVLLIPPASSALHCPHRSQSQLV